MGAHCDFAIPLCRLGGLGSDLRLPLSHRLVSQPNGHTTALRNIHPRAAASLIEILVVISIIGLLSGLSLPAIQRTRESARRVQCTNNLKQIGVALHNYEQTYARFPLAAGVSYGDSSGVIYRLGFSPHTYLLPFLSQEALYNAVNFSDQDTDSPDYLGSSTRMNQTSYVANVGLFLCPSDGAGFPASGGNSYRGSMGPSPVHYRGPSGFFSFGKCRRAGDVRDGLSHTVAFGEKLRGDGTPDRFSPHSEFFFTTFPVPITMDAVRSACEFAPTSSPAHEWRVGESWLWGSWRLTYFNHLLTPNHQIPDCSQGSFGLSGLSGSFAARSFHPGGVNVLMADGTVHFVSETISTEIWQGMGTSSNSDDAGM